MGRVECLLVLPLLSHQVHRGRPHGPPTVLQFELNYQESPDPAPCPNPPVAVSADPPRSEAVPAPAVRAVWRPRRSTDCGSETPADRTADRPNPASVAASRTGLPT